MVKYYGRARQRVGSVNTNQLGLKMSGCPSKVARSGRISRYISRRSHCNINICGMIYYHGVLWKEYLGPSPYCLPPQPRTRALAGGVGHITTPRFKCFCNASKNPLTCLELIYGPIVPSDILSTLRFLYLSEECYSLLKYFERIAGQPLQQKKNLPGGAFPPQFNPLTSWQFKNPKSLVPVLYQPWYPLFYTTNKVCAINRYGIRDWNEFYVQNKNYGCPQLHGRVEVANHGGRAQSHPQIWWFYHAPGSGIFIDLGKSLVAMNKVHALDRFLGRLVWGKGCAQLPDVPPTPQKGWTDTLTYLKKVIENFDLIYKQQPTERPCRFGAELTKQQWYDLCKFVSQNYGGGKGVAEGFYEILTNPKLFTTKYPSQHRLDVLAHGALGTSMSSPPVSVDCLLQAFLWPAKTYDSIQMLCQPNYQGGWTTEILYCGDPIFYNSLGELCPIQPEGNDCLSCSQLGYEVGCNIPSK